MDPDTTVDERAHAAEDAAEAGGLPDREAPDTRRSPDGDAELRPLEERLRRLNWPQPPEGLRERTLEDLHRKLGGAMARASNGGEPQDGSAEPDASAAGESGDPGERRA